MLLELDNDHVLSVIISMIVVVYKVDYVLKIT